MTDVADAINALNWQILSEELSERGFVIVPNFLTQEQCEDAKYMFEAEQGFRKTVVMERYRFGLGVYKYWDYPLPSLIQDLREQLYPKLAPIANLWMQQLRIATQFPETLLGLHEMCSGAGQLKPTPLILKYGRGGYNTLHQDLYGEVYFPIQAACFFSEPDVDYTGGEFVLTEQVPRAQSKAIVLKPGKGDMIIFSTQFRPVKGSRGYYRVAMRHGVSEVQSGHRYTAGIIFHDAVN